MQSNQHLKPNELSDLKIQNKRKIPAMPFGIVANEHRLGFRVESVVLRWLENHNLDSGSAKLISSTIAT